MEYPSAERLDLVEELHGEPVADPYRWLEDPADPRTSAWVQAQAKLFDAARAAWPHRDRWQAELSTLSSVDVVMPPKARGDRVFLRRHAAGRDHPVLYVREDGAERVLVDPHRLDPEGRTVLETWEPSWEGGLVACQFSANGTEDSLLSVLDVASGKTVDGPIDRVRRSSIAWLPEGRAFYYVRRLPGEERYHRRVYLHRLGTDPSTDTEVFGDGRDKTQFYTVTATPDGRRLAVSAASGTARRTDVYVAELTADSWDSPAFVPVQEGVEARSRLHFVPGSAAGTVWLRTDRDAPRGRIVAGTVAEVAAQSWHELVGEEPDAVLEHVALLASPELGQPVALVAWTRHAVAEITLHALGDGRELGKVPLPGLGTITEFAVPPGAAHEAWFNYTDHVTPPRLLHYDARTDRVEPWEPDPARDSDTRGLISRLETFTSRDGTTVRMFVVSPAGRPDRPRPALLTGYGGFGASMSPVYLPEALAWARAGGVYAAACLRGGGEEGEAWHRAGRGAHKQNVFDDFDAAADHLVRAGWTEPGLLGVKGSSNGGLLMGASLTQHPEKYAAVVCTDALLDMVRFEQSGLGPSWVPEYGSAADPEQFRTLLSYSPYHHVVPGHAYPPVLFTVAEGDTRVDPRHTRKMCAAVQHATAGPGPVLLRVERGVGHGARAVSSAVGLQADCLAFLAEHLGPTPPGA